MSTSLERKAATATAVARLAFGEFARASLEEHARVYERSVEAMVRQAVLYYLHDRRSGRLAWRCPELAARGAAAGERRPVALPIDGELLARLRQEARAQAVELDRLVQHAVLYYLADLDSGCVAARILGVGAPDGR